MMTIDDLAAKVQSLEVTVRNGVTERVGRCEAKLDRLLHRQVGMLIAVVGGQFAVIAALIATGFLGAR